MKKSKKIELSRGYKLSLWGFDRLARPDCAGLVAGYFWQVDFNCGEIVFTIPVFSFAVGRFGTGCYFGGITRKLHYDGRPDRSELLRWLYALGLSPRDCAKIADTVF